MEAFLDQARLNSPPMGTFHTDFGGEMSVSYLNVAGFAQLLYDTPFANVSAGARWERHSHFGESFVPRAAVTKVLGRAHVKLLASRAFRSPGIENIALNESIEPERTTVLEAEAGLQLSDRLYATANLFDLTIDDPIVYAYDEATDQDRYLNFDRTGTRGGELDVRLRAPKAHAGLTVSVYDAAGRNRVSLYEVPQNPSALLGLAPLKLTASAGRTLGPGVVVGGSAVLLGPRHAVRRVVGADDPPPVVEESGPLLLLNLAVTVPNVGTKGLAVTLAAYNLLDAGYEHLQPYDGGHAPLPSDGRELLAKASWSF